MGLIRYSDPELRHLISRAIHVRWPGEDLLIVTPCESDPPGLPQDVVLPDAKGSRATPLGDGRNAVVAATRSRLIYQERLTHAVLLRAIAMILGVVAIATLFFGDGLDTFAMIGVSALTLWTAAKLAELLTVGRSSMEFARVHLVDRLAQLIEGKNRNGSIFRLWVPDPSDFRVIMSLVSGSGQALV